MLETKGNKIELQMQQQIQQKPDKIRKPLEDYITLCTFYFCCS